MKKMRYIILPVFCLLFSTSCENFLDITPEGQVKKDELLTTDEGVEDALYGVYSQMRSEMLYGCELSFSSIEVLAQYLKCQGNDYVEALGKYQYDNTEVETVFSSIWTTMYKNISNANSVINCDLLKERSGYPYDIYLGEALGLRAFMHFDLVRLFTEHITAGTVATDSIPYATEFSLNTPAFRPTHEVYKLIINDLRRAEELLAEEDNYVDERDFMRDRKIHFNLYAVQATLARVYHTLGVKDSAAYYAEQVIANSGRTLTKKTEVAGDLAGVLSRTETLFGVYYAKLYSIVSPTLQQTISFSSLDPRDNILDVYNNAEGLDFRTNAYFTTVGDEQNQRSRLSKLTNVYELNNMPSNRPVDRILGINMIRLPEMYYIAAEALLETDYVRAVALFDEMLINRGLEPLANWQSTNVLTQEIINTERYKEFIGEGQTFFNMKRQCLDIVATDGTTYKGNSKTIYRIPIPDIEYENRY